jgi:hypothetical protein
MKKYVFSVLTIIIYSATCMELQLEERNKPYEKKSKDIQEQKPIDNNYLINQLYQSAHEYIQYHRSKNRNLTDHQKLLTKHQRLIDIIMLMEKAKSNNLHEDSICRFAYQEDKKNWVKNPHTQALPLFFGCLKKYIATINSTKETLPFNGNGLYINSELAQTLNIPYSKSTQKTIDNIPNDYPAYAALKNSVKKIKTTQFIKWNFYFRFPELSSCLYEDASLLCNDYPNYDITDFDHFYYNALSLLNSINYSDDDPYNFLNLIACIKNKKIISPEENILSKILNYEPTETFRGQWFNFWICDYATIQTKNRIALLYTLAEKYNNARNNRKTPTGKQYKAYADYKELNIALPDAFDATLFNENMYAFDAFAELINDIQKLMKTTPQDLQRCVNQLLSTTEI